jgi:hypothetical protein
VVALLLCQRFRSIDLADCRGIVDREPTEFVPSDPVKSQAPPQRDEADRPEKTALLL